MRLLFKVMLWILGLYTEYTRLSLWEESTLYRIMDYMHDYIQGVGK